MSYRPHLALFLRHTAFASAVLLVLSVIAERLAPGSVLSYVALWQLVLVTLALQLLSVWIPETTSERSRIGQRVILFSAGCLAICFLTLLLRDGGTKQHALIVFAVCILVLGLFAFIPTHPSLSKD
ncbi:hypothetical protein KBA73_05130 [Patescibacteria group bacterium]|nr:hypothetical protein [Patescibacteria group bacterium]